MKKIKTLLITAQSILIIGITASFSEDPLISIDVKKTLKLNSLYKFGKTCHDVILFDDETQSFNEYLKTNNPPKINPIESKPNTSFICVAISGGFCAVGIIGASLWGLAAGWGIGANC